MELRLVPGAVLLDYYGFPIRNAEISGRSFFAKTDDRGTITMSIKTGGGGGPGCGGRTDKGIAGGGGDGGGANREHFVGAGLIGGDGCGYYPPEGVLPNRGD